MKRRGKISPTRAANILGVHINTVRSWCQKAVAGEPSKLVEVERNPATGYYSVDLGEIQALKPQKRPSELSEKTEET
jgi:hypothetical protein